MRISQEKLLIKKQLFVYLLEFIENIQTLTESLDIFQSEPMLVKLFVNSVHICCQTFVLNKQKNTCFFMRKFWAWRAAADSSIFLLLYIKFYMSLLHLSTYICCYLIFLKRSSSLLLYSSAILEISALNYFLRITI